MGTDIDSDSAMILDHPQTLLEHIDSKNQRAITQAIANRIKRVIKQHKKDAVTDKWHAEMAKNLQNEYKDTWLDTSQETTLEDLKAELMAMLEVDGEPDKYENEISIPRVEEADLVWGAVIQTLHPKFPEFLGFDVWGSSRYNGYEVPLGVPCAKFSEEDCFERVMTTRGKAFEKVTGIKTPTEWTTISY